MGVPATARAAARSVIVDGMARPMLPSCRAAPRRNSTRRFPTFKRSSVKSVAHSLHGPNEFWVTVGHHDTHRMPGAVQLTEGQTVRLVAHSTERWIPVRVVAKPAKVGGYHDGIIIEQLVTASRFQVGDRVRFGEDQVMTTDMETRPGVLGRLHRRFQDRRSSR